MLDRIRSNVKKSGNRDLVCNKRLSARVDFQFVPIISFETIDSARNTHLGARDMKQYKKKQV